MRLEQLDYFVATIRAGSISAAAQKMGITRQAVSTALSSLEEELGLLLLVKTNHGVKPTPQGRHVFDKVVKIQKLVEEIHQERDMEKGSGFVVCTTPLVSLLLTSKFFLPFKKLHPNIEVIFKNILTYDLLSHLESGVSRIAITRSCLSTQMIEVARKIGYTVSLLYTDECRLFMAKNHPLARKETLTRDDLSHLKLAIFSKDQDIIRNMYADYFAGEYRMANRTDMISLAVTGEAVLIQPRKIFNIDYRVAKGDLVERDIPIEDVDNGFPITAILAPKLSRSEQKFWEFIRKNFVSVLDAM